LNFTFSDSFEEETQESFCGYDVTDYDTIGEYDDDSYMSIPYKYLEFTYEIESSMIIKGLGVLVSKTMYDYDANFNHYTAKINGLSIGSPDCWQQYGIVSYILFWEMNTLIQEENILIELYHSQQVGGTPYWYIYTGYYSTIDYNKDGIISYKYHSEATLYNGIYDGTTQSFDVSYLLYVENVPIENEQSPYDDMVITNKLTYDQYEPIKFIWFTSDVTKYNYIKIYNKTGECLDQLYPKQVSGWTGRDTYFPLDFGFYRLELVRDSITRASINVTVIEKDTDYVMFTYPCPSEPNTPITLYYKYDRDDNNTGLITRYQNGWEYDIVDILLGEPATKYWNIEPNSSAYLSDTATWDDTVYRMYSILDSNYFEVASWVHDVGYSEESENSISVSDNPLYIYEGETSAIHHFSTKHNFYGFKTSVYLNGKFIQDVTYKSSYVFDYEITEEESKTYNATLVLETINGSFVLDYVLFNVIVNPTEPSTPAEQFDPLVSLAIGFAIPLGFLCIPLYVSYKARIDINIFIYLFMGVFGLILSMVLGFIDPVIIGAIIVILSLIIIGIYLSKKQM